MFSSLPVLAQLLLDQNLQGTFVDCHYIHVVSIQDTDTEVELR